MALTPDRIISLKAAADALAAAGHGKKTEIATKHAGMLDCDVKTLYRQISEAGFSAPRKRRSDAGKLSIDKDEALAVMALKKSAQRANGKDNLAVGDAGELVRANGIAALGRLDKTTGELVPVSDTTLRRAIRAHRVDLKTGNVVAQADSSRYRQCGNGMASVVVEWIAHRIVAVEG